MQTVSSRLQTTAAWSIYPFSWLCIIAAFGAALHGLLGYQQAWGMLTLFLVIFYAVAERLLPYEARWSMTWASFKADIKYIATNVVFIASLNAALAYFTISVSGINHGPASDWPLWLQLAACLLIFEALNYSIHRAMHEAPGRLGKFLWNVHAAHHLPEKVYVVMHAVFHPLNAVFVQVLAMTVPIWFMGYDQKVAALFLMINSMHGLISHFNMDVRMGWANYVFVGTEVHRYHHSADVNEAKNYGATLTLFDILFGTFVYRPGVAPNRLGVSDPDSLPRHADYKAVLALPFHGWEPNRKVAAE
jgi:sterol desaturase/sphingolipid hydroxylase (fatty acid hydroxylase superfamily)